TPDLYPVRSFWLVRDGGEVAAAALRTAPYNLILARPRSPEALAALAEAVAGEDLPGAVGSVPEVEELARIWSAHAGRSPRTDMRQGVYALERVEPPPETPGSSRVATADDWEVLFRWWVAFGDEVLHEGNPGRERAEQSLRHKLDAPTGGLMLWEDEDEPVSFAGWGGPTPNGIRIGPVYTPPELRGRGYATALTAELSQQLLDGRLFEGGRRFCFLYTDLANPTSNAIYERVGYRRVAESAEIVFS
ncbi:MAG TPA: GNAT family N-acetyltransferase, partial [Gaiellaceae bacterium]|nr:GNAT family N-acetyltransferase [Gaiellaceae bacterium]